ncbi:RND transporter [Variovorax sp. WS11]|uniref:efflux RND transporter permease subunit n=1 Tax=Variovorax sp. WS11 TaxID=1105204 RepID=UPI000D0CE654|nr:MMPL family transporter [Variovorax sp. WS11]NDZ18007.1 MMPL family transporter [Variovorax sp. WS11]PSL85054.1 RND transporter [Variovorax sp. WS11]
MITDIHSDAMPVVRRIEDFDPRSGNWLERTIFNHRALMLVLCFAASLWLGWQALHLRVNASYEEMFPQSHPYMRNYLEHREDLGALGNTVRIAVENTKGDIFDPAYLQVLAKVTDQVMVTKGVNRGWVKSLWLPTVRWTDVIAEGYAGGPVMPDGFDGSPAMLEKLRLNVQRANLAGQLVSPDFKSSMIVVPMLDHDPDTGKPLDYEEFGRVGMKALRALETDTVKVHAVGFSVLMVELIEGLRQVMLFFGLAVLLAGAIVYAYSRCLRSTLLLLAVSLLGVVWLLGLISLLDRALNPYSILVPFLIFAIGISHGAQKMNGIAQDVARGTHRYVAARYTFRRLFLTGLTALLTNVLGFAVLMWVDIPVIREMAFITSIGVTVLIFTKLVLIPVALSYIGVSHRAAQRRLALDQKRERSGGASGLAFVVRFCEPRWATAAIATAMLLACASWAIGRNMQVGDLDPGAPEVWPGSTYNRDVDFINRNFGLSSDQFAVMVATPRNGGQQYDTLIEMDRLGWLLQQDPDVQAVNSIAADVPHVNMGQFEANPKWLTIPRNSNAGVAVYTIYTQKGLELVNADYSLMPVVAYLTNHKAETLARLLKTVEDFARKRDSETIRFLPVAGSAGIEAVTNVVVRKAHFEMLWLLYGAVALLCFVTFRNWRAVIVALIPLLITALISEAVMVLAGIGLKVATLPVHALGVGVGVDYALYLLSVQLAMQRRGASLAQAYGAAVSFTGRVVALIGVTMAVGVITWTASPIKFQADMGLLLAFMFVWNMVGALVLIPALSYFLLRQVPTSPAAAPPAEKAVPTPALNLRAGPLVQEM